MAWMAGGRDLLALASFLSCRPPGCVYLVPQCQLACSPSTGGPKGGQWCHQPPNGQGHPGARSVGTGTLEEPRHTHVPAREKSPGSSPSPVPLSPGGLHPTREPVTYLTALSQGQLASHIQTSHLG